MTTKGTDNRFRSLTVVGEAGTPATPGTGDFKLYVADDGTFYVMDDTGTPTALGGGSFSDPMTTRGDIIVRNASNVTARLGIGSAGKVLSSDGTDVSWQTPASSGSLILLEQHTASSSATLDFTTAVTSTYEQYLCEFVDVLPATNQTEFWFRASTDGGSTYLAGTSYGWNARRTGGETGSTGAAQVNLEGFPTGLVYNNSTAGGLSGFLRVYGTGSAKYKKCVYHTAFEAYDASVWENVHGIGAVLTTSAINAFRFLFSSGNIASGSIRVYGVAK